MDALLLAAGYGTRLGHLTKDRPKPLLDVAGQPMLDRIVERVMATKAVDRLIVVTNDRFYEHFEEWARTHEDLGAPIVVLNDGTTSNENRRGANGDIRFAIEAAKIENDLLVVGGDNLFSFDLSAFLEFAKPRKAATVVYDVETRELASLYGIVATDDDRRITSFVEKPKDPPTTLISTCIYYYNRGYLPLFERYLNEGNDPDRTGSFLQWAYKEIPYYAYTASGRWWDIGDEAVLEEARSSLRRG